MANLSLEVIDQTSAIERVPMKPVCKSKDKCFCFL